MRLGAGGHNKDVVAWRAVEPHGGTEIWRVGVLLGELWGGEGLGGGSCTVG